MDKRLHIAIAAKGQVNLEATFSAFAAALSKKSDPLTLVLAVAHDNDHVAKQLSGPAANKLKAYQDSSQSHISIQSISCPSGTSILKLWGIALAEQSADYVAVLDANCPPSDQWLTNALTAMEKSLPVFYGSVEPGWPMHDKRIVGYLTEYAQFKAPIDCDSEYPGNNIVFDAQYLAPSDELRDEGFFKTFMVWRLEREYNITPTFVENMDVYYAKGFETAHYMARRKIHGQCFGGCRLKQENQPPRWACILFTPLLFIVRTARIYKWIGAKGDLKRSFFRFLPLILGSEIAWSYGEFLGYTFGEKDCCQHLD